MCRCHSGVAPGVAGAGSGTAGLDRALVSAMLSAARAGLDVNRQLRPLSVPDEVLFRVAVIGCLAADHTSAEAKTAATEELVRFEKLIDTTAAAAGVVDINAV